MKRLEGKTAIITGATRGIGAATSRRFAAEGAKLVTVARNALADGGLPQACGSAEAVFVRGSVTERDTAEAAVAAAVSRFGSLDILVNNAGVDFTGDLLEVGDEEVRAVFETNFFGAFMMLQAAALAMKSGGSIVNVTSRLASIGAPTMTVYGASKGAMLSLTRGAAIELAPRRIRVNAVAPGLTETPILREWLDGQEDSETFARRVIETIPQKRFALPEEVAAAIAYLASDESAHVTGASLPVDGGYTAA